MSKDKGPAFPPGANASVDDPAESGLTKAKLDDTELSNELPKALQKVELDLDDAPFLEDEKEEEPPAPLEETPSGPQEDAPPSPWWKRKVVLFGGLGLVLAILAGVAFLLLFVDKKTESPSPPPGEEPAMEEIHETPQPPAAPPPLEEERVVVLDPFLVEQTNEKGEVFLVTLQFSTSTTNPELEKGLARNAVVLRDSVYYFLKNKQLIFLDDAKTADALKKDIMSVMNQFLGEAQVENLFIEKYVVK